MSFGIMLYVFKWACSELGIQALFFLCLINDYLFSLGYSYTLDHSPHVVEEEA